MVTQRVSPPRWRTGGGPMPADAVAADPFGEHRPAAVEARLPVLGADFHFRSASRALIGIAERAYAGLPGHRLSGARPVIDVHLLLTNDVRERRRREPAPLRTTAGAGLLCGSMDAANFALLAPAARAGLVAISRRMLAHPYHARYELLEFAVFTLAARVQQLVPLHAACVAHRGRGLLLMGASGAGKTTLALECLLQGFDFVSEDSTFVASPRLLATGVANYLHLRPDALGFVRDPAAAAWIRRAPLIRRRSGVAKLELDLRHPRCTLAPRACHTAAIVLLSRRPAGRGAQLRPLGTGEARRRLAAAQPYAAHQAGWEPFVARLSRLPVFELRRGAHPADAVPGLRALLAR